MNVRRRSVESVLTTRIRRRATAPESGVRDHRGRPPRSRRSLRRVRPQSKTDDTGDRVKYLLENDVGRWVEFPLWLPEDGLRADPVRKPGLSPIVNRRCSACYLRSFSVL